MIKDALILAGGKGTRLSSVTKGGQKVIVDVAGKPFLVRLLDKLISEGFRSITIAAGYRADDIKATLRRFDLAASIKIIVESSPLGTGGAIKNAFEKTGLEEYVVLNGDSFNDINYSEFLRKHRESGAVFSILTTEVPDISRFGEVLFDRSNRITGFREKTGVKRGGVINAGVYAIKKEVLREAKNSNFSIEEYIFTNVKTLDINAVPSCSDFRDIGTPDDYYDFVKLKKGE